MPHDGDGLHSGRWWEENLATQTVMRFLGIRRGHLRHARRPSAVSIAVGSTTPAAKVMDGETCLGKRCIIVPNSPTVRSTLLLKAKMR
jgi:hypothetical protein